MPQNEEKNPVSSAAAHPDICKDAATEDHLLDAWGGLARKVERARQQLTDAFDAVDELMFIHDRDGRILRANRAYADHASGDYRQIIGKLYWEVFPLQVGPLPRLTQPVRNMTGITKNW